MILTYSAKKQNAESVCKMPPSRQFFKSVVSISGSAKKVGKRTVFSSPFRYAENRTQKRQNRQKSDFINPWRFIRLKCVSGLLTLVLFAHRRSKNHVTSR